MSAWWLVKCRQSCLLDADDFFDVKVHILKIEVGGLC